jgi:cytidine deaminase
VGFEEMTFEAIYAAAVDVAEKLAAQGEQMSPDKTICVICSASGRIYYGRSHLDQSSGSPVEIHAEIDAVQHLQGMGESQIDTLILINSYNRLAMLPCNNCIGFLTGMNPANSAAMVAMPDRLIPFSEIAMYAGGGMAPGGGFTSMNMNSLTMNSMNMKTISAKGSLLKDRVGAIMDGVDDDDDDEEVEELIEEAKTKKKKFFGLFG